MSRTCPRRRRRIASIALSSSLAVASAASAQDFASPITLQPINLQQRPESIYAPAAPPRDDEGVNEGGVHLDLTIRYMTDYVFRGIDRSEVSGREDAPNLQFDGKLEFDFGKAPHPFIGLFANVYDEDDVSQFQEVRPIIGIDWPIKPLTFTIASVAYIFPERDEINTAEAIVRLALDDAFLWSTERPIFSPYVSAAYDYDLYNGWYFEAGVKHDFIFDDTGFRLTLLADVGYAYDNQQFLRRGTNDSGFQHYDIGLIGNYSVNNLFNISRRWGEFAVEGYLYYTDGIDNDLLADTQIWGGFGINFKY